MTTTELKRLVALVEGGVNLIVDGYVPSVEFKTLVMVESGEIAGYKTYSPALLNVKLTPNTDWSNAVDSITIDIDGVGESNIVVASEDGEQTWDCLKSNSTFIEFVIKNMFNIKEF